MRSPQTRTQRSRSNTRTPSTIKARIPIYRTSIYKKMNIFTYSERTRLLLILIIYMIIPNNKCQESENFRSEWSLGSQNCQNSWTCKDNILNVTDSCECDEMCGVYDDCCIDVEAEIDQRNDFFKCRYIPGIKDRAYVSVIDGCPLVEDQSLITLCSNNKSNDITLRTPVFGTNSGFLYRNMYCAICHGENYLVWKSGIQCSWKYDLYGGNYSLSALENDTNCKEVFEPPSLSNFTVRECLPVVDTCNIENLASEKCRSEKRSVVFGTNVYRNVHCALCNGEILANLSCDPYSIQIYLPKEKRKIINYSYRLLVDLNSLSSVGVAYSSRKRSESIAEQDLSYLCQNLEIYDPFTERCRSIFCSPPYIYKSGKCMLILTSDITERNMSANMSSVDEATHMSCPYVRLNQSEFQVINEKNVFILSSKTIYTENDSYIGDGFALICIQSPSNRTKSLETDTVTLLFSSSESFLSIFCECLSIVALCLGLTIYICFRKLHNVPGKNLICLMASLLTAQVFFILAPFVINISKLCFTFALIIHYMFLSAFFWMNVMAVDTFLTFSKGVYNARGDKKTDTRHFVFYSLYSWLTPMCIVVAAIIFDFVSFETDTKPMYGKVVCWISNSRALLYFFLVPLFILVFANIVLFIFTARAIYKSDKNTSKILQRKQKCKLLIYLKLSVVMGCTWVFACIATFTDLQPFWYMFIIFNALQGVFIFLSFVCTKKVLRLLKSSRVSCLLFCYKKYDSSSRTSQGTSSKSTKTLLSVISYKSKRDNSESSG